MSRIIQTAGQGPQGIPQDTPPLPPQTYIRTYQRRLTNTAGDALHEQLIPANPRRRRLILRCSGTQPVAILGLEAAHKGAPTQQYFVFSNPTFPIDLESTSGFYLGLEAGATGPTTVYITEIIAGDQT